MNFKKRIMSMGLASAVLLSTVLSGTYGVNAQNIEFKKINSVSTIKMGQPTGNNGYIPYEMTLSDAGVAEDAKTDALKAPNVPAVYMNSVAKVSAKFPTTRNQNPYGSCWAHAATAMMEFSMISKGYANKSVDYSELQLAYFTYNSVGDPLGGITDTNYAIGDHCLNRGGNSLMSSRTLASWTGSVNESLVPYSSAKTVLANGLSKSLAYGKDVAKMTDAYVFDINPADGQLPYIKQVIMNYGCIGVDYCADFSYVDKAGVDYFVVDKYGNKIANDADFTRMVPYNGEKVATYYCPFKPGTSKVGVLANGKVKYTSALGTDHAVVAVGWDDTFPRSNFAKMGYTPAGDGAWLIRNSWTTTAGNSYSSYFWLSYYDQGLDTLAWSFIADKASAYERNYQYDGGFSPISVDAISDQYGSKHYLKSAANVFKAKKDECIKAITLNDWYANDKVTIDVYVNVTNAKKPTSGKKILSQTVTLMQGTHAIKLKKPVYAQKGTKFAVVIKSKLGAYDIEVPANLGVAASAVYASGNSFILVDGKWYNTKEVSGLGDCCIKALTTTAKVAQLSKTKKVSASSPKSKAMKITWKKIKKAKGYEVYVSTDKKFKKNVKKAVIKKGSKTSVTIKGLKSGKKYYVKVRGYISVGGTNFTSPWAAVKKPVKVK